MKRLFRKQFLAGIAAAAMAVLTLASCSNGPDLGAYIPGDATGVMSVDLDKLWDKADLSNIEQLSFAKLGLQELRSEDPQVAAIIDGILKDPRSTGLDLKGDLVAYAIPDRENGIRGGILITMHKRAKFEEFIEKMADVESSEVTFSDLKGFRVAKFSNYGPTFVFNNKLAMMFTDEMDYESLLEMKHKESLGANKHFRNYWKNRSEISMWLSFDKVFKMAELQGADIEEIMAETGMGQDYWDAVKESAMAANLTFEKGVIRVKTEVQGISNKVYDTYGQEFNDDIVKYLPEQTLACVTVGYNFNQMVSILQKQKDSKSTIDEVVFADKTVGDLIKAFGGSFALSLSDIVKTEQGGLMPLLTLSADIKDAETIRAALAEAGLEEANGIYTIPDEFGLGTEIYFAIGKKAAVVTNSKATAQQFGEGGYKKAIDAVAKKAKEGNYVYANLDLGQYPAAVTDLIPSNSGSLLLLLAQCLDRTEIYTTGKKSANWDIYIKDTKQNSLLAMMHFVDDHLVELGNLTGSMGGDDESPVYEEEYYVDEEGDWEYDD